MIFLLDLEDYCKVLTETEGTISKAKILWQEMVKQAITVAMDTSEDVPNPTIQGQGCGRREIPIPDSLWIPRRLEVSLKE